jgi:hypothetical protein
MPASGSMSARTATPCFAHSQVIAASFVLMEPCRARRYRGASEAGAAPSNDSGVVAQARKKLEGIAGTAEGSISPCRHSAAMNRQEPDGAPGRGSSSTQWSEAGVPNAGLGSCSCLLARAIPTNQYQSILTARSRNAFAMTLTEESAMAAAATTGDSRRPNAA